jgi:hypothetical protein
MPRFSPDYFTYDSFFGGKYYLKDLLISNIFPARTRVSLNVAAHLRFCLEENEQRGRLVGPWASLFTEGDRDNEGCEESFFGFSFNIS